MTISSKLTIFYHNQLTPSDCRICGGRVDPNGFDFGLDEVPDQEPSFVCHSCAEYLRPDLIEIQRAAFEFARSGMARGSGDAGKSVEGMRNIMPWMRGTTREQAAAPAAAGLPTDKEYLAGKHAQNLEIECMPLVRELVEAHLQNRQDLSLQDIQSLEFYLKNQVVVIRP